MPSPRIVFFCATLALFSILHAAPPDSRPLVVPPDGHAGFTRLTAAETAVEFINHLDEVDGAKNRTLYNGSGVAAGDFDGDGLPDLYFCSLEGKNRLYKNLGNFKFKDVTVEAGVEGFGFISRGAVFADLNSDGKQDLLVGTTGNGVLLFLNDGKGHFRNATKASGLASQHASVTMALADVNGDGILDLYVCNNRSEDFRDKGQANLIKVEGKLTVPPFLKDRFVLDAKDNILEYGEPDQLYINDGKAHFKPVSWTEGAFKDEDGNALAGAPLDWGLTAAFRDINGDGFADLYVCNDYWTPDRIWFGDGKGGFRAAPRLALRQTSASSMGVDFGDIDRDGHPDFMVVDMLSRDHQRRKMQMGAMKPTPLAVGVVDNRPQNMRNTLQLNRGDGTFAEIANFAGVAASEWSWQPLFLDVDLDGWEDLLISSGHFRDVQDADTSNKIKELQSGGTLVSATLPGKGAFGALDRQDQFTAELLAMSKMRPRLDAPIVAFRNLGNARFEPAEKEWGTGDLAVHHGFIYADLDGDGDLDLVVNNLEAAAGIYRNNSSAPRVAVRLRDPAGNVGIGAKVKLLGGAVPMQSQEIAGGGRYLSGCDTELCFAAGKTAGGMTLEVTWPGGAVEIVKDVQANWLYTVGVPVLGKKAPLPPSGKEAAVVKAAPLFTDASALLNHTHHENEFDDFKRQLLLPNRLSQLGPGVSWADLNGDGLDDLLVGSAKDGAAGQFINDGKGGFAPGASALLEKPAARDQSALVAWTEKPGAASILAGLSSFEDGDANQPAAQWSGGALPGNDSSTGALAMADVDGDGQLDLFVAGRSVPGRYPEAASSRLFRRSGGQFVPDEKAGALFSKLGLVSGAVFSDLNGDGAPDLVLAMEWGPIAVFLNDGHGIFHNATAALGLEKETGWWNGVTAGDFDGDGRMDIAATNWGLNSKYEHHYDEHHPLLVYWGEFNGDGTVQVIESHFDHGMDKLVPERGLSCSSIAMPFIRKLTPTYTAYGGSGLAEIYGDRLKDPLSINTLAHKVFLNRGDHFEAVELPFQAQIAPGFGVNVADLDGDGNEDLFMTQNFFATQVETARNDAGLSLCLKGDGKGGFAPLSAALSGIRVWGDARGSALADYDADGRVDLVVGQNGSATRLFHNTGAKPGLRVRLAGPDGNTNGIGAQIRLIFGNQKGPVREIHAGSGYWSQDSAIQVLATPAQPAAVWVRWPGGKQSTTPVPAGASSVTLKAP